MIKFSLLFIASASSAVLFLSEHKDCLQLINVIMPEHGVKSRTIYILKATNVGANIVLVLEPQ